MAQNLQQLTLDNASVLSEMLSASGRNSLSLSLDGTSETTDASQGGSILGGVGGGWGGSSSLSNGSVTRGGSVGDSGGEERISAVRSPTQPKTLQQEFAHINLNVTNVDVDMVSVLSLTELSSEQTGSLPLKFSLFK